MTRRYVSKNLDQRRAPINSVPLGVDWSANPESIPDGAAAALENWEYDYTTGALRTAKGVTVQFERNSLGNQYIYDADTYINNANDYITDDGTNEITSLLTYHQEMYYTTGKQLRKKSNDSYIGDLIGDKQPISIIYGDTLFIASGGQLQSFNGTLLKIVPTSPIFSWISDKHGRVFGFYQDSLYFSSIGDATSENAWKNVTTDISTAQVVPVGYKDAGNIVAVELLTDTIIVHKASGRIYAVTGQAHEATVTEITRNTSCLSNRCALSVGGKSYFLGNEGLMSIIPTQQYDNMRPFEDGRAVNGLMSTELDNSASMWHLPLSRQIWIRARDGNRVYLYHYTPIWSDGRGAFTTRTLTQPLNDVIEFNGKVYVAYGNKIAILDENSDKDDNQQIQAVLMGKATLPPRRNLLVKNRSLLAKNIIPGTGTLQIGKKIVNLIFKSLSDQYIEDASQYIDDATGFIYSDDYTRWRKAGGGGTKRLQPILRVFSGSIELRQLEFEYVEV